MGMTLWDFIKWLFRWLFDKVFHSMLPFRALVGPYFNIIVLTITFGFCLLFLFGIFKAIAIAMKPKP